MLCIQPCLSMNNISSWGKHGVRSNANFTPSFVRFINGKKIVDEPGKVKIEDLGNGKHQITLQVLVIHVFTGFFMSIYFIENGSARDCQMAFPLTSSSQ